MRFVIVVALDNTRTWVRFAVFASSVGASNLWIDRSLLSILSTRPELGFVSQFSVSIGLGGKLRIRFPCVTLLCSNRQDLKLGSFRVFHVAGCVPSGPAIGLWVRLAVSCRGVRVEVGPDNRMLGSFGNFTSTSVCRDGPTTGLWVRSAVSEVVSHSRSSSGVWLVLFHACNPKKQNHVSLLSSITRNRLSQFSWIWRINFRSWRS